MNTYEKKYNYVLKRAKALKECSLSPRIKDWVDSVFPELKESEDEKIRKDIKRAISVALDYSYFDKETVNKCLAWLENQGKEECALKSSKDEDVRKFMQYIEKEAKAYEFNLPNRGYDIYAFAKDVLIWFEKQRGKKPIDKVEPKFKVGDWIVSKTSNLVYRVDSILLPQSKCYYLSHNGGKVLVSFTDEQDYHLWTIQDAKVGDVLFSDLMCGKTFIYNGVNSDMAILYSFIISNDGDDVLPYHIGKPNTGIGTIEDNKNIIHPATKEQRDHLFAKMRETGYEWDEEKKEVKKIEKQGEQKETLCDKCKKAQHSHSCQDIIALGRCYIEGINTSNKVEPKWGDDENSKVNDETNAPTGYGKYVDECLNEASKHFFSDGEDKYSVADLFYAGVRCGKSWFEKQGKLDQVN